MKSFVYDGSNGATAQKVLDQIKNECVQENIAAEINLAGAHENASHENEAHHGHPLAEVHSVIEQSHLLDGTSVSENAKKDAKGIFELLTECECAFHQKSRETIHFHEIGRKENILRICLICELIERLGITQFSYTPLNLGHGKIECSHGILNVPAPATELLIKDMKTYSDEKEGELTSPSGAAIIKYFSNKFSKQTKD
ncbi:MAG: LarC family nickel insertion protein [Treponemataceae bacterium]|nr:LarC family nickel insertion protein [Treponemataceae bacterium]